MDTKGINKLLIYKFVDVTHSLHKLFETLVASRLTLILPAYIIRILIWLLFVVFFWAGKKKRIVEMSSHCFKSTKLHFHCHSNNLHINVIHSTSILSSQEHNIEPSPSWNICFPHLWQHHLLCHYLSLGLVIKVRAWKDAGQKCDLGITFTLSKVWRSAREWTHTLPNELPLWELDSWWTPEFLESYLIGQKTLDWSVPYTIVKHLICRCLK
jgi:hypothetical protein